MDKKMVPEVRFKGFTDDWEQQEFFEIVTRVNKSSNSNDLPKLEYEDINSGYGTLNKDISKKFDNRKGIVFEKNYILFGKLRPYLKNWFFANFKGIAIGDFWVFQSKKGNPLFIYYLIQSPSFQKIANDTSGTKMPRSDWKRVSKANFFIPNTDEQIKLGKALFLLDNLITLQQQQLDLYTKLKKGLLQKLFPKDGEKVPEVRFADFHGDWELRKLNDVVSVTMGQSPKSSNYTNNPKDYILVQGNTDIVDGWVKPRIWTKQITKSAKKGSTLLSVRAPVGDVSSTNYDIVIGRGIAALSENSFIFQLLKKVKLNGYWNKLTTGSTFESINSDDIKNLNFYIPFNIIEQEKVSDLLSLVDNLIFLQQEKMNELKLVKKYLLQKLFI